MTLIGRKKGDKNDAGIGTRENKIVSGRRYQVSGKQRVDGYGVEKKKGTPPVVGQARMTLIRRFKKDENCGKLDTKNKIVSGSGYQVSRKQITEGYRVLKRNADDADWADLKG